MIAFLTSNPAIPKDAEHPYSAREVNGANGLIDRLAALWKPEMEALFISAAPAEHEENLSRAAKLGDAFAVSGLPFAGLAVWDGASGDYSAEALRRFDLLILAGGHVPTQNAFFQRIGLREKLAGYPGIVLSISAGTMNSAEVVYAQPELEGEATDPGYQRFLPGLGLTRAMVLPHYQAVRRATLDGMRLFEDITYGDSMGRAFYALVDGSYLLVKDGVTTLYGEGYRIADGKLLNICAAGGSVVLPV
ncbi:MAG: dipeptidase E [Clostridiales bacterium]|nr:dipeptidase E [Clostridiales bacterium]